MIRSYEGVLILHPDTAEDKQKEFFTKNKSIIEQHEGELNHIDTWGRRTIANPINDVSRGIYFHYTFTANNTGVAELERTFRINDQVLRYMHTQLGDTDLKKHVEAYKDQLAQTAQKEKEREAKRQARRERSH